MLYICSKDENWDLLAASPPIYWDVKWRRFRCSSEEIKRKSPTVMGLLTLNTERTDRDGNSLVCPLCVLFVIWVVFVHFISITFWVCDFYFSCFRQIYSFFIISLDFAKCSLRFYSKSLPCRRTLGMCEPGAWITKYFFLWWTWNFSYFILGSSKSYFTTNWKSKNFFLHNCSDSLFSPCTLHLIIPMSYKIWWKWGLQDRFQFFLILMRLGPIQFFRLST